MVYIFVGPDNVGKTTAIENLRKYLSEEKDAIAHILHYSKSYNERYARKLYDEGFHMIKNTKYNLIFDRFHDGEYVYSPMYRNYSGEFVFEYEEIWYEHLKDKVQLIYLYGDAENLSKKEDGLSLSNGDKKRIKKELKAFDEFYKKTKFNKLSINTTNKTPTETFNIIRDNLLWRQTKQN